MNFPFLLNLQEHLVAGRSPVSRGRSQGSRCRPLLVWGIGSRIVALKLGTLMSTVPYLFTVKTANLLSIRVIEGVSHRVCDYP